MTISCALDGEHVFVQPLSVAGVSVLADRDAATETLIEKRALQFLRALPAAQLHAHGGELDLRVTETQIELPPPKRHVAWATPVVVNYAVLAWRHGSGITLARVPALDLTILIENPERFDTRVADEIRFALQRNRISTSLWRLAQTQRMGNVETCPLKLSVPVKTPRQAAEDEDKDEEKEKSALAKIATDLVKESFEPAVELDDTLRLLADTLGGRNPQSVLLVGASGVGKTAAVHELVRRRAEFHFGHTPFWATSGARLVAGMTGFGQWQERCTAVIRDAAKTKAILHLGNLVELMSVGKSTHNQQGIASFLRPYLARGELLAIAECTPEQLALVEREDPHVLNAFAPIRLEPADAEKTRRILKAVAARAHACVANEAIDEIVRLHTRYATYSAAPGRPLRFLKNLLQDTQRCEGVPAASNGGVSPQHVTAAFSRETGLPLFMLDDDAPLDLPALREWFSARVIGQPEPVEMICDLLAIVKARLARPRKPLASFLFIGPTGVGKTELAKSLAQFLFGGADRMIRFDMSEFADPLAAQRLIAGTAEGEGLLTARVREQPFCVLLLDEFEKADPAVFDLLLQVLGEGRLTDAAGRVADFCNAAIILTSNLGAQTFQRGAAGFADARQQRDAREHFVSEVKKFLRPEMFNRIDAIVPFAPLDQETVLAIARREIDLVRRRDGLRTRDVQLKIADGAIEHLARRGFDARYGARPLKRTIERDLLVPLADALSSYGNPNETLTATVTVSGKQEIAVNVRAALRRKAAEEDLVKVFASAQCVQIRRKVQRMTASPAVTAIENTVTQLAALKQKLGAKATRQFRQAMQLDRLPKLERLLHDVQELERRAVEFENDILARIYAKTDVPAGEAEARARPLLGELNSVARRIFAAQFEQPDFVTLCIFGEDRSWMFRLAHAYWELATSSSLVGQAPSPVISPACAPACGSAGEGARETMTGGGACPTTVHVREVLASHTGQRDRVVLKNVSTPKEFFAAQRKDVLGVILGIHAPLAWPRFEAEAGDHLLETDKRKERAIVDVAAPPFEDYRPPAGIDRPGYKATDQCRAFHEPTRMVKDSACGAVPWDTDVSTILQRLTETRLNVRIGTALNILT